MNGSGTPRTGNRRSTTPMFSSACPTIQIVMPPETIRTNGSFVLRMMWKAPIVNSMNSPSTTQHPMSPSSSPTIEKM